MKKINEGTITDGYYDYIRVEGLLDPRFFNNCYRCALYPTSVECRKLAFILGPCKEDQYFKKIILIDKDDIQEIQII
jgi:hypothetical protein